MNEIKSIQSQIEKIVLTLSYRIENIYSSLEELKTITQILFTITPYDAKLIEAWLKEEEFKVDEKNFFKSFKTSKLLEKNKLLDTALTYQWSKNMQNNEKLKFRFYSLRNIAKELKSIKEKLGNISFIYYQDILTSSALAYPYFDMSEIIPHDFDWKSYHAYLSVNKKNNPSRTIKWSTPNIDYAGEGLISIASIPIYKNDTIIGVWSIDVPLKTIHEHSILDVNISEQINFICDFNGSIITHPTIKTKIDKQKGSFYQENIKDLEEGFKTIDLDKIKKEKKGQFEIENNQNETIIVLYETIPNIEWIIFATFPRDKLFESIKFKITEAFTHMKLSKIPNELNLEVKNNDMQILIDSYNDMIKVLAYNQLEKEKAQKESLSAQKALNEELEQKVKQRTKELEKLNIKLSELANKDSLTNLYNRRHFFELINSFQNMTEREEKKSMLLMLDIDKFKNINDTYGHDMGDKVLQSFAKTVASKTRKGDIFARFGGEEFIIFLPYAETKQALLVAEKIRKSIEKSLVENIKYTISIGLSKYTGNITTSIKEADKALYKAKENGRNQVVYQANV